MVKVFFPSPVEARRISEIYITSMTDNIVLQLKYPTEEQRVEVQEYAASKFQSYLKENPTNIFVVRENDDEKGQIMSFLKYETHRDIEAEAPKEPESDAVSQDAPEDLYEKYLQVTKAVRTKNMRQPYIHLSLLCTARSYQSRGAARALIEQLKTVAVEKGLPIYLESTMNAVHLYEKLGWKHVDWIRMRIPKAIGGPLEMEYKERCMLWDERI